MNDLSATARLLQPIDLGAEHPGRAEGIAPLGESDSDFTVDPASGAIVYPDSGGNDTDIGLIRLAQHE